MAEAEDRRPAKGPLRLGRGLQALLGEGAPEEPTALPERSRGSRDVPIDALTPNTFQPRRSFDPVKIQELTDSIREKGILQPILVRRVQGRVAQFEIIAGERRWRAAQAAGLHQVPVVIKDMTDLESLEAALIENIQRADLNPVEEALGYRRLMDEFSHTQEQLGVVVGKSRSHVANMLRLLTLSANIQQMLTDGALSMGHARALVSAADPETLAREIVAKGLSVRQAEKLAQGGKAPASGGKSAPRAPRISSGADKDADTRALEQTLSEALGLSVQLDYAEGKGGQVRIHYQTLEQLDDLCNRLCQSLDV